MHLITPTLLTVLLTSAFFALTDLRCCSANGSNENEIIGALFFIDNNLTSNHVVGLHILADGTLSTARITSTGGKGGEGFNASDGLTGVDAIFSQDAVTIGKQKLFAVNAGSNTLSFFTFDVKHPTALKLVGEPADSGGEFPVSVAFNEEKSTACVLNGGAKNGVRCFNVDAEKGLTVIPNTDRSLGLNQTTPPVGAANTVSDVIFDEAGENLLVSVKGTPPLGPVKAISGFIASFAIAADGSLAAEPVKSFPNGGLLPYGMTIIPGTKSVIATDPAIGVTVYNFDAGGNVPAASNSTLIPGQLTSCWVAHSVKTGSYYVTDPKAGLFIEVSANENVATVLKIVTLNRPLGLIDLAVAHTRSGPDFLYVNAAGTQEIVRFKLTAAGNPTLEEPFDVGKEVPGLSIVMKGLTSFVF